MSIEKEIQQTRFKSEYQKLALNIMVTNNWLTERVIEILKPFDITTKQFNVLRILRGQRPNPITVCEIRKRMIDKMSDVSRIIERLRKKELVSREICENNRRAVDIYISDKGLKLLDELDSIENLINKYMGDISVEEAKQVNNILDRMRAKHFDLFELVDVRPKNQDFA